MSSIVLIIVTILYTCRRMNAKGRSRRKASSNGKPNNNSVRKSSSHHPQQSAPQPAAPEHVLPPSDDDDNEDDSTTDATCPFAAQRDGFFSCKKYPNKVSRRTVSPKLETADMRSCVI